MLIALAVIVIVKIASRSSTKKIDDEEFSNTDEFVLNDFSEDQSNFEQQIDVEVES